MDGADIAEGSLAGILRGELIAHVEGEGPSLSAASADICGCRGQAGWIAARQDDIRAGFSKRKCHFAAESSTATTDEHALPVESEQVKNAHAFSLGWGDEGSAAAFRFRQRGCTRRLVGDHRPPSGTCQLQFVR